MVQSVADANRLWKICVVGVSSAAGVVDVRVYSSITGPEGHILASRSFSGTPEAQFVSPVAGQMYFEQTRTSALLAWGFPEPPLTCGGSSLVIFRDLHGTPTGYSLLTGQGGPTTRFSRAMSAWFTTAAVASAVEQRLEGGDPLPAAGGPITIHSGVPGQEFIGLGWVAESSLAFSPDALSAHC